LDEDELNERGTSDLVLQGDGSDFDATELYQLAAQPSQATESQLARIEKQMLRSLYALGWFEYPGLPAFEIDATRGHLDIRLQREDGRRVHLFVRDGKTATIERWDFYVRHERPWMLRGHKEPMTEIHEPIFLGREKRSGIRSGLLLLANYVADNPGKTAELEASKRKELAKNAFRAITEAL
jgi:hypothetical protein